MSDENGPGAYLPKEEEKQEEQPLAAPQKKKSPKVLILGVILGMGLGGLKIALKSGMFVGITEAEIAASKFQDWPKEFKAGMFEGCVESSNKEAPGADPKMVSTYCQCYVDKLEGQHLITTKFNTVTSSEEKWSKEAGQILGEFLNSQNGIQMLETCVKVAQGQGVDTEQDRKPASL